MSVTCPSRCISRPRFVFLCFLPENQSFGFWRMSNAEKGRQESQQDDNDDEPDEWCVDLFFQGKVELTPEGTSGSSVPVVQVHNHQNGLVSMVPGTNGETDENTRLNDCFREKKDWRACKDEVRALDQEGRRAYLLFSKY